MSKVITENSTNLAKYVFDDGDTITYEADRLVCPAFIVADLNSGNCTEHISVADVPGDYVGNRYFYDGADWTVNPDWVDPEDLPEE